MAKHPNEYLNEFVAHFALTYLKNFGYRTTNSPINTATWKFLERAKIDPLTDPWSLSDLAHQAAIIQRRLVLEKSQSTSLRSIARSYESLRPLVAHGPQAWLINTYRQLLENILELDLGYKEYGINKEVYRNIQENVMAARMMFESASKRLATKMFDLYRNHSNLAFFEGGAGNGAAMLTNLRAFHTQGIYPEFWLSDIDRNTKSVAEKYFREHGFPGNHFPWTQIDIGNPNDLLLIAKGFPYQKVIFNVNFIVHEWEPIASKFFSATSQSLPKADLVVSEFFLPEDETVVGPDFPWWFVYLHDLSGQYLRTEKDFLIFPKKFNYQLFDRIDYQTHNGSPVTSTLFLKK